MLKKIKSIIVVAVSVLSMSSCSLTLPVAATGNPVGSKVGTSTATCYFGVLCLGQDASIQKAARDGGIKNISTVDLRTGNFLNLIVTYETIVTGE